MEKLVIIGSGPAGLTAVLYAARANLDPMLIEGALTGGSPGGQLMTAGIVENFPALPGGLAGPRLVAQIRDQVKSYPYRSIAADVQSVNLRERPFVVLCSNGKRLETSAVIVASGSQARRLPLESEKKFWEMGVSACAICDGGLPLFRNRPLAVIGGGDSAAEEALHLTQFGSKVYLIHRRETLRASRILQDRLKANPKIEILLNKTVVEFLGDEFLSGVRIKDERSGETTRLDVQGAFEAIGHLPNTGFLNGQLDLHESGTIRTTPGTTHTSIKGVFAAGDVADTNYRQAITAAASGCMAEIDAERWLRENDLLG